MSYVTKQNVQVSDWGFVFQAWKWKKWEGWEAQSAGAWFEPMQKSKECCVKTCGLFW